jgi:hypothetical protein
MQDEYANRHNMHLTVLKLLESPEYQGTWKNQKPLPFTVRAAQLGPMVNALTDLIAAQQLATTGYAETKAREEAELENIAYDISQTLVDWYEENGRDGEAAHIDLSLSSWQDMRDPALIAKARVLHLKLTEALATDAAALAAYGLAADDATQLAKELADFEKITADPSLAISKRRSLTVALRPRFREVSQLLKKMDRLVPRFRKTEAGTAFANAWDATRIIRDLGGSAPGENPEPQTPTA